MCHSLLSVYKSISIVFINWITDEPCITERSFSVHEHIAKNTYWHTVRLNVTEINKRIDSTQQDTKTQLSKKQYLSYAQMDVDRAQSQNRHIYLISIFMSPFLLISISIHTSPICFRISCRSEIKGVIFQNNQ